MKKIALNEYCPCCGYNSLNPEKRLELEICQICYWEDDPLQFNDPNLQYSCNLVSLAQAQKNFDEIGVSFHDMKMYCRNITPEDKRNPEWK
ncbi:MULTISPECIES: CPCC family cysteine-rich protein [unclassified Saccharicrinis]|uniref:CPCC family cysteine-rich protein n=1 Tax=unclassified Saccharicrinis TaxID=2646859 RepID=UPI003D349613